MNENTSMEEWLHDRPQVIKDMVRACPPHNAYALTHSRGLRQKGYIVSYAEEGTVTMVFPQTWNPWQKESREVFGIKLADLTFEPMPFE